MMSRKFSLAYLTIPGVTPLEQIEIAARTGYDSVSLRTIPMGQTGEPQICLEKDPELFRKIRAALKSTGLTMLDIELVRIREDLPVDYRKAFECGAELGATDVLTSVWTKDYGLAVDRYGSICEQAREFGLTVNLEFPIVSDLTTLEETMEMQDQVGMPNFKILMDMIYCHWAGVTGDVIESMDPERFGLIHLCDCPKDSKDAETVQIVRGQREYCGLGTADLPGMIRALPPLNCSIELPNYGYIEKYGAEGHAAQCLKHVKEMFASCELYA